MSALTQALIHSLILLIIHFTYALPQAPDHKPVIKISLNDFKRKVLERNVDYIIGNNNHLLSKNDYTLALKELKLPTTSLKGVSGVYQFTDDVNSKENHHSLNLGGTLSLIQKLPWGTTITASAKGNIGQEFFDPPDKKKGREEYSQSTTMSLEITHPIFGWNDLKFASQEKKLAYELNLSGLKDKERDLLKESTDVYYDYVINQEEKELTVRRLTEASNSYEETRNKFKAGLITEVDLLKIELSYKRNFLSLEKNKNDFRNLMVKVNRLLSRDSNQTYVFTTAYNFEKMDFNLEESLSNTYTRQTSLLKLNQEKYLKVKRNERTRKQKYLPRLNAFARAEQSLQKDDVNEDFKFSTGLEMESSIFNRSKRKLFDANHTIDYKNLLLNIEKKKRELRQGMENDYLGLVSILREISISEDNLEVADKVKEIDDERFRRGIIRAEVQIDSDNDYYQNRLNLIRKRIQYSKKANEILHKYWMVVQP